MAVAATCTAAAGPLKGALSCCGAEICSTFFSAIMAIACGCITALLSQCSNKTSATALCLLMLVTCCDSNNAK